ncbi:MAG TPA: helix-turn-helix domain-containing protein [Streptosporangiaceae bacterium]|jgi:DNA-binding HxlR family transcriptional regulator|nr:helix-turn-helix domain-containing protein [Streptosporangiaceae bacterium]
MSSGVVMAARAANNEANWSTGTRAASSDGTATRPEALDRCTGASAADSEATGTRPAALDWSIDNCTIQRALAVLGDRWTFVVMRELFNGIRRFDEMRIRTEIPRQVLSDRLTRLVGEGLLRREPYREPGRRQRDEYRLTSKGLALYPVLVALNEWGSAYYADEEGSPLAFSHRDCGGEVGVVLRCSEGHDLGRVRDVAPAPGPGAHRRLERAGSARPADHGLL